MTKRGSTGLAAESVHGASDAPPKGRHLHPFDWIDNAGAASGEPARHGERLAGGGCSAAHASWAAKDQTSRLSARRMGRGNGEQYSGRADMAGIPSLPVTVQRLASGADIRLCRA